MTKRSENTELDHDIFDNLFHGCAFAAYVEIAVTTGEPPDCEATRRLAFQMFEEELRRKNGDRPA